DREVPRGVVHEHAAHWFGRPVPCGARWYHLSAGEQLQHAAGAVEHSVRGGPGDGERAVDVELVALLTELLVATEVQADVPLTGRTAAHRDLPAGEGFQVVGERLGDRGQLLPRVLGQHQLPAQGEVRTVVAVPLLQGRHDLQVGDLGGLAGWCGRGRDGGNGKAGEQRRCRQQGGQSSGVHRFSPP